ncbi:MAG: DUF4194 domain-containing protein [Bacilli bacterium]|jgi:hypothetical protein
MFIDDYNKMSRSDRALFSETVNDLLYQCFIVRKTFDKKSGMFRADPDYLFIERHYSTFEDYLSYMDMQMTKNDDDGVVFVSSGAERNHLRLDSVTTLIVYALRSFYEGAISKTPQETEVMMTSGALNSLVQEMGLSNLSKRLSASTIASSLRQLDSYNVVSRANGTYGDPSYSFFILPTIKYVISSEKMNTLYDFLTKGPETEEEPSLFDKANLANNADTSDNLDPNASQTLAKALLSTPSGNPDTDIPVKDEAKTETEPLNPDIPVKDDTDTSVSEDSSSTEKKDEGDNN